LNFLERRINLALTILGVNMKTLKQLSVTILLVLALGVSVYAGDVAGPSTLSNGPSSAAPAPGDVETPSTLLAPGDIDSPSGALAPGDVDTGMATLTAILLGFLSRC
jgi:hypothetical protein